MAADDAVTGFCVLYRWRLHPGHEEAFARGWLEVTELYLREAGSHGSRLHKCDDGTWAAYAQWPDRAAWEAAGRAGFEVDGFAQMREAVAERFEEIVMTPEVDRLR